MAIVNISEDDMGGGALFPPFSKNSFFCGHLISFIFKALNASMQ